MCRVGENSGFVYNLSAVGVKSDNSEILLYSEGPSIEQMLPAQDVPAAKALSITIPDNIVKLKVMFTSKMDPRFLIHIFENLLEINVGL